MHLVARYYPATKFRFATVRLSIASGSSGGVEVREALAASGALDDPRDTADVLANNCAKSLDSRIIETEEMPAVPNGSGWTRVYRLG